MGKKTIKPTAPFSPMEGSKIKTILGSFVDNPSRVEMSPDRNGGFSFIKVSYPIEKTEIPLLKRMLNTRLGYIPNIKKMSGINVLISKNA